VYDAAMETAVVLDLPLDSGTSPQESLFDFGLAVQEIFYFYFTDRLNKVLLAVSAAQQEVFASSYNERTPGRGNRITGATLPFLGSRLPIPVVVSNKEREAKAKRAAAVKEEVATAERSLRAITAVTISAALAADSDSSGIAAPQRDGDIPTFVLAA
jgi:hypothetical protein